MPVVGVSGQNGAARQYEDAKPGSRWESMAGQRRHARGIPGLPKEELPEAVPAPRSLALRQQCSLAELQPSSQSCLCVLNHRRSVEHCQHYHLQSLWHQSRRARPPRRPRCACLWRELERASLSPQLSKRRHSTLQLLLRSRRARPPRRHSCYRTAGLWRTAPCSRRRSQCCHVRRRLRPRCSARFTHTGSRDTHVKRKHAGEA